MIPRTLFSSEHETFRASVRRFLETEVKPHDEKWQEQGYADKAVWQKAGANYLDVNLGAVSGKPEDMIWMIEQVQAVVDTPISIDTNKVMILQEAIKACKHPPLLNSTTCAPEKLNPFVELCVKYNASMIGLAMDESGSPKEVEKRLECAGLIAAACRMGAILADVSEERQSALFRFGQYLGIAFQVADDVLDVEGNVLNAVAVLDEPPERIIKARMHRKMIAMISTLPNCKRPRKIKRRPTTNAPNMMPVRIQLPIFWKANRGMRMKMEINSAAPR